jgi:hypothetical protein
VNVTILGNISIINKRNTIRLTGVWFILPVRQYNISIFHLNDLRILIVQGFVFTIVILLLKIARKWKLVKKTRNSSAFLRIFLYPLTHFQKIQKDKGECSLIHTIPIFHNFLSLWRLNSGWV